MNTTNTEKSLTINQSRWAAVANDLTNLLMSIWYIQWIRSHKNQNLVQGFERYQAKVLAYEKTMWCLYWGMVLVFPVSITLVLFGVVEKSTYLCAASVASCIGGMIVVVMGYSKRGNLRPNDSILEMYAAWRKAKKLTAESGLWLQVIGRAYMQSERQFLVHLKDSDNATPAEKRIAASNWEAIRNAKVPQHLASGALHDLTGAAKVLRQAENDGVEQEIAAARKKFASFFNAAAELKIVDGALGWAPFVGSKNSTKKVSA